MNGITLHFTWRGVLYVMTTDRDLWEIVFPMNNHPLIRRLTHSEKMKLFNEVSLGHP